MLNIAALHEAVACAIPQHECLVFRQRRLTWRAVQQRTRRFAQALRAAGLGCRNERNTGALNNWQSGQDHIALYLYNGNEYLEAMLGAFKARCAPFNVNYRYTQKELSYLLQNGDARAVVFHARFAPKLAALRAQLPQVKLWIEVPDESGEHLPGAHNYEDLLAAHKPAPPQGLSPDDLYVLYTGGTTGLPKGVLWRQEEILRAALLPPGIAPNAAAVVERARRGAGFVRALPLPPFMHGAAHWAAFSMWFTGATVYVQPTPEKLDAKEVWSLVARESISALSIVGDAFAQPLLEELRTGNYTLTSVRTIASGGAILSPAAKRELLTLLPGARIIDVLGASESGQQAVQVSRGGESGGSGGGAFKPGAGNLVLNARRTAPAAPGEIGWLARRGPSPLGYYKSAEKSAQTFPVVEGVRYALPGDRAVLQKDGGIALLGRDSATINSGGEKIYAEEVEQALKLHSAVWDAVVIPTPHPRFGQQVTALVALQKNAAAPGEDELRAACEKHIARYKLPRLVLFVPHIQRAPSGKPDYRWAKAEAARSAGAK